MSFTPITNFIQLPDLVNNVLESVTFIYVEGEVPLFSGENRPPLFGKRLRKHLGKVLPPKVEKALGSGVVLTEDGYIVTNRHVVAMMNKVTVHTLLNGPTEAEIIKISDKYDLALIKAKDKKWTPLQIADVKEIDVGEPVIAVGNPLGLESSVSFGIVSAMNRTFKDSVLSPLQPGEKSPDRGKYVQTDAVINPGNSGGALVSMDSKLIGVNSMSLVSPQMGVSGLNFAVQIDVVMEFLDTVKI
jgi:serine protease Do